MWAHPLVHTLSWSTMLFVPSRRLSGCQLLFTTGTNPTPTLYYIPGTWFCVVVLVGAVPPAGLRTAKDTCLIAAREEEQQHLLLEVKSYPDASFCYPGNPTAMWQNKVPQRVHTRFVADYARAALTEHLLSYTDFSSFLVFHAPSAAVCSRRNQSGQPGSLRWRLHR